MDFSYFLIFDSHLIHISAAPPSSVFFLGGSVEFPNLSFTSELTDSSSPQFRLQAQALNHYVSGAMDLSVSECHLSCCLTFTLRADLAALTLTLYSPKLFTAALFLLPSFLSLRSYFFSFVLLLPSVFCHHFPLLCPSLWWC